MVFPCLLRMNIQFRYCHYSEIRGNSPRIEAKEMKFLRFYDQVGYTKKSIIDDSIVTL